MLEKILIIICIILTIIIVYLTQRTREVQINLKPVTATIYDDWRKPNLK